MPEDENKLIIRNLIILGIIIVIILTLYFLWHRYLVPKSSVKPLIIKPAIVSSSPVPTPQINNLESNKNPSNQNIQGQLPAQTSPNSAPTPTPTIQSQIQAQPTVAVSSRSTPKNVQSPIISMVTYKDKFGLFLIQYSSDWENQKQIDAQGSLDQAISDSALDITLSKTYGVSANDGVKDSLFLMIFLNPNSFSSLDQFAKVFDSNREVTGAEDFDIPNLIAKKYFYLSGGHPAEEILAYDPKSEHSFIFSYDAPRTEYYSDVYKVIKTFKYLGGL